MPRFSVTVTRDASASFTAIVEAGSEEEIKNHCNRHGYAGPIIGNWVESGINVYDDVEDYEIKILD